jgi:hypothetical protein
VDVSLVKNKYSALALSLNYVPSWSSGSSSLGKLGT